MLSNTYFLPKCRFDTAESEPAKNFQKIANSANFAKRTLKTTRTPDWRRRPLPEAEAAAAVTARRRGVGVAGRLRKGGEEEEEEASRRPATVA